MQTLAAVQMVSKMFPAYSLFFFGVDEKFSNLPHVCLRRTLSHPSSIIEIMMSFRDENVLEIVVTGSVWSSGLLLFFVNGPATVNLQ